MNSPVFKAVALLSLDSDLKDMVKNNQADAVEAIQLQVLRIMRGRPFNIDLTTKTEGHWTDGKNWHEKAPGS